MSRFVRSAITLSLAAGVLLVLGLLLFAKTFYPGIGDTIWKLFFLVVAPVLLLASLLLFEKRQKK